MTELYGRYHGRLLALARTATADKAWRATLREILSDFDDDCRQLPQLSRCVLRNELAGQIEREALQFSKAGGADTGPQAFQRLKVMPSHYRDYLIGHHSDSRRPRPAIEGSWSVAPEEHEKHLAAQRDNSDQDGAPKGEALR